MANRTLKLGVGAGSLSDHEIEELLAVQREAQAARNFAESDRLRDLLTAAGILLDHTPDRTTLWRRQ